MSIRVRLAVLTIALFCFSYSPAIAQQSIAGTPGQTCADCEETLLVAGVNDNFALPEDRSYPSPEVIESLVGYNRFDFDGQNYGDDLLNAYVAHTFSLPENVVGAELELHIRAAASADRPWNDTLRFGYVGPEFQWAWVRDLTDIVPTGWTFGDESTITIDLTALPASDARGTEGLTSMLDFMASGYLDVMVGDDTKVDYYALRVWSMPDEPTPQIIYVDADATGLDDGSSWANAHVDLRDALEAAVAGDEVWIAEGEYQTDETTPGPFIYLIYYNVPSGVRVYGGFQGFEMSLANRDWLANQSVVRSSGYENIVGIVDCDSSTVLDGIIVRGPNTGNAGSGIQISNSSPRLRNVIVEQCHGNGGAGVHVVGQSHPKFENTIIRNNTSYGIGGGVWIENEAYATFIDVTIEGNFSYRGAGGVLGAGEFYRVQFLNNLGDECTGGLELGWSDQPAVLRDVLFQGNHTYIQVADYSYAGGMSGYAELTNVQFIDNSAGLKPGVGGLNGGGTLTNVLFQGNVGYTAGGMTGQGILRDVQFIDNEGRASYRYTYDNERIPIPGVGGFRGSGELTNVTFKGNQGLQYSYLESPVIGGMLDEGSSLRNVAFWNNTTESTNSSVIAAGAYCRQQGEAPRTTITNTTFSSNGPRAIVVDAGSVDFTNSILWEGHVGDGSWFDWPSASVTFAHSLVAGSGGSGDWNTAFGVNGGGNIDSSPRFVDLPGGNLQLIPSSPAVNGGDTGALPSGLSTDLDGNPRIFGDDVDMGAYELQEPACEVFPVVMGETWDDVSLQEIFDSEYGVGAIDVATEYEGYQCGDAVEPYWIDTNIDAWLVREIAGFRDQNTLGWHVELFSPPVIDGINDGVIFEGSSDEGQVAAVTFPAGETRFGFYLNPNGSGDTANAPEPELFFTNRRYNDAGPEGNGDERLPDGGDPQCLIYNITDLRGGTPTYVLAWEDIDYGSPLSPTWNSSSTDNDFNDLVVEIQAMSPVPAMVANLTAQRVSEGVRLTWSIEGATELDRLELVRRIDAQPERIIAEWSNAQIAGEWIDAGAFNPDPVRYRLDGYAGTSRISSQEIQVAGAAPQVTRLVGAVPNPFNPSTQVQFELGATGQAKLSIYDLSGRLVRTLVDESLSAGPHAVTWNGKDDSGRQVASGVYLYQLKAGGYAETKRMVLLK